MKIERSIFIAGNISFPIRNIASLAVRSNPDKQANYFGKLKILAMLPGIVIISVVFSAMLGPPRAGGAAVDALASSALFGVVITIAMLVYALVSERNRVANEPRYYLDLLTNANRNFELYADDASFLQNVKVGIEEAMQKPEGAVSYTFNRTTHKIDRQENISNTIQNSTVGNYVGGSAHNVTQTANITIQGLQDVAAMMQLIQQTNTQHREFFLGHLGLIQNHLSGGGAPKEAAQASWQEIIKYIGHVAGAGNKLWELVARIGRLFA